MCLVIVVVRHGKQLIEYFSPLFSQLEAKSLWHSPYAHGKMLGIWFCYEQFFSCEQVFIARSYLGLWAGNQHESMCFENYL